MREFLLFEQFLMVVVVEWEMSTKHGNLVGTYQENFFFFFGAGIPISILYVWCFPNPWGVRKTIDTFHKL